MELIHARYGTLTGEGHRRGARTGANGCGLNNNNKTKDHKQSDRQAEQYKQK